MLRLRPLLLLIIVAGCGDPSVRAAQGPPLTSNRPIKVSVNLIIVPARVVTATGRPAGNLTREEFQVLENGKEQPISIFAPTDAPVDVALVVDTSGSTAPHMDMLKKAAQRFVDQFGPADTIGLYAVSTLVARVLSFTRDRATVKRAIGELHTGSAGPSRYPGYAILGDQRSRGGTLLYDGLLVIQKEFSPSSQRRVILVFTDAIDSGSTTSFDALNFQTLQGSVTLFTVMPYRAKGELPDYLKVDAQISGKQLDPRRSGVRKNWLLVLDQRDTGERDQELHHEAAITFLRELAPEARVWLFDFRDRLRPLAFPQAGETGSVQMRPLTPSEAETLLPLSKSEDYSPVVAGPDFQIRVDRILILTNGDTTRVQELTRAMNASPGELAAVRTGDLASEEARAAMMRRLIHDPLSMVFGGIVDSFQEAEDRLLGLSRDTGGAGFRVKKAQELGATYEQIAAQIRSSFTLGYYSGSRAGRHTLEVKVPGRDVTVHARRAVVVF